MKPLEIIFNSKPKKSGFLVKEPELREKNLFENSGLVLSILIPIIITTFILNSICRGGILGFLFVLAIQFPSFIFPYIIHKFYGQIVVPFLMIAIFICSQLILINELLVDANPLKIAIMQIFCGLIFLCLSILDFVYLNIKNK